MTQEISTMSSNEFIIPSIGLLMLVGVGIVLVKDRRFPKIATEVPDFRKEIESRPQPIVPSLSVDEYDIDLEDAIALVKDRKQFYGESDRERAIQYIFQLSYNKRITIFGRYASSFGIDPENVYTRVPPQYFATIDYNVEKYGRKLIYTPPDFPRSAGILYRSAEIYHFPQLLMSDLIVLLPEN